MARNRLSGATSGAMQASIIGFVMAGCIAVGYLIGNWLDGKLGTTYWMPIMVILGMIAGAREMWMTVIRIRDSFSDGTFENLNDHPNVSPQENARRVSASKQNRAATADPSHRKPRFFSVPAPPSPQGDTEPDAISDDAQRQNTTFESQLEELRRLQQQIDEADSKKDEQQ